MERPTAYEAVPDAVADAAGAPARSQFRVEAFVVEREHCCCAHRLEQWIACDRLVLDERRDLLAIAADDRCGAAGAGGRKTRRTSLAVEV